MAVFPVAVLFITMSRAHSPSKIKSLVVCVWLAPKKTFVPEAISKTLKVLLPLTVKVGRCVPETPSVKFVESIVAGNGHSRRVG